MHACDDDAPAAYTHPPQVLQQLNLERCSEGHWRMGPALLAALMSQVVTRQQDLGMEAAQKLAMDGMPPGLQVDLWCTVLVLAFLR